MASPKTHLFSLLLFFFILSLTSSKTPSQSHPKAVVLPLSKHALTLQYITQISQRTPLVPLNLVIDLGGPFLWVSCDSTYISSSKTSSLCNSTLCSLAHISKMRRPICRNTRKCILFSENVITTKVSHSYLSQDVLSLHSTNGLNPLSLVSLPHFPFLCAPKFLLQGLASGTNGIVGLGNTLFGLPPQLSSGLNFPRKFSICLPSESTNSNGVIFFGDGPYVFSPGIDVSKLLIHTPLIIKPNIATSNYYIIAESIRVNGKKLPTNSSLVMLSTINPYSILETSIYNSVTDMFIQEANVTRVTPVAPFDVCFSTKNDNGGLTRPSFPIIDLILQDERVFWRIFETNSMVVKGDDIVCLGFLDGGFNMKSSIVIGGFQLEDNLLQFDLGSSTLGFTNSLLLRQTSCSNFNFTFDG